MPDTDRTNIVVIAASAGGVSALQVLCAGLPRDLRATLFIVQHLSPSTRSMLPAILERAGVLPVRQPVENETIREGHIYVAPPDHHMLVKQGYMLIRKGPKENHTRPAADPLFRSAAVAYGPRVVGLVLTGTLDDGTGGLLAVKRCGGVAVVQDPADAAWPDMPRHALHKVAVDHCLQLTALPELVVRLSREPAGPRHAAPGDIALEAHIAEQEMVAMTQEHSGNSIGGKPSLLTCPDCGGALMEVEDGPLLRFRCHVGHAYSPAALAEAQGEALEQALWMALRTHNERLKLCERMQENAEARDQTRTGSKWAGAAGDARSHVDLLRTFLTRSSRLNDGTPDLD